MNRLKDSKTYLVGSIQYAKDSGEGWRDEIIPFLKELEIQTLNPLNKPGGEGREDDSLRQEWAKLRDYGRFDELHEEIRKVVSVDLRLVDVSDFIICYIDTDVHTAGSYHELAMAALQRKPVLIVCKQGKKGVPLWWFGVLKHKEFFDTFEELKNYLKHMAYDEDVDDLNRWKFLDWSNL